jgi:hypothetical protein
MNGHTKQYNNPNVTPNLFVTHSLTMIINIDPYVTLCVTSNTL